ncbi:MAG TPA: glycosyltransferase family 39 protein [Aggregatilineales bacterium]|nr:glycosyltransferase family 39 protein [Aggregatilineales bacterium]
MQTTRTTRLSLTMWIAIIGVLFTYLITRFFHLLALPPFIDEHEVIAFAQDVYRGRLLTGAAQGRLLLVWYASLFQMTGPGVLWLTRGITALFATLNVAVIFSLGKRWASRWVGLLGAVLYILSPYVFFHDRLGLSDTFASTFGLLSLWFAVRFTGKMRPLDSILSGLMVTLAITAKATGVMLVAIPATCIVLLLYGRRMRQMVRGLAYAYAALIFTWVPLYLVLRWRHFDYFGVATTVVGTTKTSNIVQRFAENILIALNFNITYFSIPAMIIIALLALYLIMRKPRIGLLLAACTLVPLAGILAFGTKLSGRYMLLHVPPLLLLTCVAAGVLAADIDRRLPLIQARIPAIVGLVGIAVWAILFALPFLAQAWSDPSTLALPAQDRLEYIEADSSGYTLKDSVAYLNAQAAQSGKKLHAIGLVANCGSLHIVLPPDPNVEIECPLLYPTGIGQPQFAALINDGAKTLTSGDDLWVIYEGLPYATLDGVTAHYELVITFQRPGNLSHMSLLHVTGP